MKSKKREYVAMSGEEVFGLADMWITPFTKEESLCHVKYFTGHKLYRLVPVRARRRKG